MSDKSPRQSASKKSGKSLKEKRREKKAKGGPAASDMERLTTGKGHGKNH
ncbi:hypothetical protein ACVW00_001055 [Marmoricola sp. URHA0025 HA25]